MVWAGTRARWSRSFRFSAPSLADTPRSADTPRLAGNPRTVVEVLEAVAASYPDHEAYVDGDRRLTFSGLARASAGVAGRLAELGIGGGDVVAICLPSSVTYAAAYLGILYRGAVATGINPRLGRRELDGIYALASPKLTVIADGAAWDRGPFMTAAEVTAAGGGRPAPPVPARADDPVCVVWTSGTTGLPKGAVFDHANLEAMARAADEMSRPFDRRLSPLPFAHVGYMTRLWDEIANVTANVIVPTPWTAEAALDLIESERITVAQGVPTQWDLILRHPSRPRRDTSSLRLISTGGTKVPVELVARLQRAFGRPVIVRYASTEASVISGTRSSDPPEVAAGTVGRPLPTVDVRVVGDDGEPLPAGEVGMIEVRSPAVMRGYLGGEPSPIRPGGWLVIGDLGSFDDRGQIRLVGRRSEMYLRGGYNVYPLEVEKVLTDHPAVAEAAVAGVPDEVLGQIGVAWVVPADPSAPPDREDIRKFVKEQLADYKAPDRVVVVDDLPRNQMGKVDKRALAAEEARW